MDVCPRVSVLCCPVSVEALRWTDPVGHRFAKDCKCLFTKKLYHGTNHWAVFPYWPCCFPEYIYI
jgi:hypothetical protein